MQRSYVNLASQRPLETNSSLVRAICSKAYVRSSSARRPTSSSAAVCMDSTAECRSKWRFLSLCFVCAACVTKALWRPPGSLRLCCLTPPVVSSCCEICTWSCLRTPVTTSGGKAYCVLYPHSSGSMLTTNMTGNGESSKGMLKRPFGGGADKNRCSQRKGQSKDRNNRAIAEIRGTSPSKSTFCSSKVAANNVARVSPTRPSERESKTLSAQAPCQRAAVCETSPRGGALYRPIMSDQSHSSGLGNWIFKRLTLW
mmetsp:Transcript_35158/g.99756  ORF Transcript_35158/g.99756 Transcript_35158/m.99756 type:complete len:256 (-) Transcript_35158:703-1470(-)